MAQPLTSAIQPILRELSHGLSQLYGARLKGLMLYGSYARAEATDGSDIDVALILDDFSRAGEEIDFCSPFVAELCLKHRCVISIVPIRSREWRTRHTPLLMNIQREGVAVA